MGSGGIGSTLPEGDEIVRSDAKAPGTCRNRRVAGSSPARGAKHVEDPNHQMMVGSGLRFFGAVSMLSQLSRLPPSAI